MLESNPTEEEIDELKQHRLTPDEFCMLMDAFDEHLRLRVVAIELRRQFWHKFRGMRVKGRSHDERRELRQQLGELVVEIDRVEAECSSINISQLTRKFGLSQHYFAAAITRFRDTGGNDE